MSWSRTIQARLRTGSTAPAVEEQKRIIIQGLVVDATRHIVTVNEETINFYRN